MTAHKIGDGLMYTYTAEDAVKFNDAVAAGDTYPMLVVTVDNESGGVSGYVFAPHGIHYVGPVQMVDSESTPGAEQEGNKE